MVEKLGVATGDTLQMAHTFVGKFGCQADYYKLKSCISTNTLAGQSIGLCDPLYDAIGECIMKSYRETDGLGVLEPKS